MSTIINASTSSGLIQTADTSGTLELQSNGTTQLTVSSTGTYGQLKSGTAQASTSGTSIDFTSIPSWVKRITVMFNGVSTSGASLVQVRLGVSGTPQATGYTSTASYVGGSNTNNTTGFFVNSANAGAVLYGNYTIVNVTGNTWVCTANINDYTNTVAFMSSGAVALSGVLNMIRITTVNGTDTFDAGSINILYEG